MQTIAEIMTRDVTTISPQATISQAAQMMDDLNIGALPVCDGKKLVGMITDRDITIRATSASKSPDTTHVDDVMSTGVQWCFDDQSTEEVMQQMGDVQIRRVPVLDRQTHALIGVVSLGDLAINEADGIDRTLENISFPAKPQQAGLGSQL